MGLDTSPSGFSLARATIIIYFSIGAHPLILIVGITDGF
jgi:hypothetical protein